MNFDFLKSVLAEDENGKISSGRVRALWWDAVCTVLLSCIVWHVIHLADTARVSIWLSNLPMLIVALIALTNCGYLIGQGSSAIVNMFNIAKGGGKSPDVK